jgi:hypothetical protein
MLEWLGVSMDVKDLPRRRGIVWAMFWVEGWEGIELGIKLTLAFNHAAQSSGHLGLQLILDRSENRFKT